jgi:hypothetical protein
MENPQIDFADFPPFYLPPEFLLALLINCAIVYAGTTSFCFASCEFLLLPDAGYRQARAQAN